MGEGVSSRSRPGNSNAILKPLIGQRLGTESGARELVSLASDHDTLRERRLYGEGRQFRRNRHAGSSRGNRTRIARHNDIVEGGIGHLQVADRKGRPTGAGNSHAILAPLVGHRQVDRGSHRESHRTALQIGAAAWRHQHGGHDIAGINIRQLQGRFGICHTSGQHLAIQSRHLTNGL